LKPPSGGFFIAAAGAAALPRMKETLNWARRLLC